MPGGDIGAFLSHDNVTSLVAPLADQYPMSHLKGIVLTVALDLVLATARPAGVVIHVDAAWFIASEGFLVAFVSGEKDGNRAARPLNEGE